VGDAVNLAVLAVVLLPFGAAIATHLTREKLAEMWTYLAAVLTFGCVLFVSPAVLAGRAPEFVVLELLPGLELAFRADLLGLTFAGLASALWIVTSFYSSGYARAASLLHRRRYFACFAASIGAANAIAFSTNVLTMVIGFELLTVVTYPLVAHNESREAISAGRRYLVYALSGGLALTVAAAWTWSVAGTLEFTAGGFLGAGVASPALFFLYFAGAGVKAAIMPLHGWLPAAMVAPSPVSALLHAVAVVKAGVFGCIRFLGFVFQEESLRSFSGQQILIGACALTIVAASILALKEDHLKRRLAYSTIASLSTITLGAALLTPNGIGGALIYFVNHAVAKITLFFCAGALYTDAGREKISELGGVGREMPWTMAAFTIATLSLIGVPGLGVFVAKLTMMRGAVEASEVAGLTVLAASSLLSAAYLLPIVRAAFFDRLEQQDEEEPVRDPRLLMRVPLLVTAAATVVLGCFPPAMSAELEAASALASSIVGRAP
jgi:multicomponent Na+:H+ antiporter subunit D